jgi:DNA-directed RNA polymerase subunit RPC12/RpoP
MMNKDRIPDIEATASKAIRTVKCADCGKESEHTDADSELVHEPCQHCGSNNRPIMIFMAKDIQVKELLKVPSTKT